MKLTGNRLIFFNLYIFLILEILSMTPGKKINKIINLIS